MFLRNSQTYSHPLRLVDHLSLFHRPHSLTQVTKAPTHSTNPSQALVCVLVVLGYQLGVYLLPKVELY